MMKSIVLLCPTRGRPHRFQQMWDSARTCASTPSRVSVRVGLDCDDPWSSDYRTDGMEVLWMASRQGSSGTLPRLMDTATEDYWMLGGDDCLYRTPGWDELVVAQFAQWPDDLGVLYFDNGNTRDVPEALAVSRTWALAAAPLIFPGFTHFLADQILIDVARAAGRLHRMDNVCIEHCHWKYGKADNDETYRYERQAVIKDRDRARFQSLESERVQLMNKMRSRCGAIS